jgi:FkbM family methyltransferase
MSPRPALTQAVTAVLRYTQPLTRWARHPLRWFYHLSPALKHDVQASRLAAWLPILHRVLVNELPAEFRIHRGRVRFRSERSAMALHAYYVGEVEYHVGRFITSRLTPGFTMIDVGAHHGAHAVVTAHELLARGLGGHVHAFEPDPGNREILAQNARSNGLEGLITVRGEAVCDLDGTVELLISSSESSGNTLSRNAAFAVAPSWTVDRVTVPALTLDSYGASLSRLDLLKIDVQGAEPAVLAGAKNVIAKHRPIIVVEAVPGWPSTPAIEKLLTEYGYEIFGLDREGRLVHRDDSQVFVSWDWVALPVERA